MTRATSPTVPLLERQDELAVIDTAVTAAAAGGQGGVLLVEGPAGIGKTRLVETAGALALGRGFLVLSARSSRLERGNGFGVVRSLLEPAAGTISADGRPALDQGAARLARRVLDPTESATTPVFAALHGLYWFVVALAEQRPLLLAVDDLHWADPPSASALLYVAHRLEGLPILLALTTRPAEPGADLELLDALRAMPSVSLVRPGPLSSEATAAVVRHVLGDADDAFGKACHDATGGNPLLLGALARSMARVGVSPSAEGVAAVRRRAPAVVATFVLPRLRHLPRAAVAAARALAVLGPGAALRHVAAVAELDPVTAAAAVDDLVAAELVVTVPTTAFAHPLLAQVVAERMPGAERHAAHVRAARELTADGASAQGVAAHLHEAEPLRDGWVVGRLRDAARAAMVAGAPQVAVAHLERALAEPATGDARVDVLFELGDAQCQHGPTDGFERLAESLRLADDPARRDGIALQLARRLEMAWELPRALTVLDRAVAEVDARGPGDPDAALLLETELVGLARPDPARRDEVRRRIRQLRERTRPGTVADAMVLANVAVDAVQDPDRTGEGVAAARQALSAVGALPGGPYEIGVLYLAVPTLAAAGELGTAAAAVAQVVGRARDRGAIVEVGASLSLSADLALRRGAPLDAEADGRAALELIAGLDMPYPRRLILGYLLPALVVRGRLEDAERDVATLGPEHRQAALLAGLGRLRLAQGRPDEGLAHLRAAGQRLDRRGWHHPGLLPWRTDAAMAQHLRGEHHAARGLAADALAIARRYAAAIPTGVALRTLGVVADDLDALQEAVEVLAPTEARLEHASAHLEHGASLRRHNHRRAAREPLRQALEGAHHAGAAALVARATEELAAAGSRPRTPLRHGVEALSSSERRVAGLAARGMNNRDIAQTLFVTAKTVEAHLSACYRKLDISSRAELAERMR